MDVRVNPFLYHGKWWWRDENQTPYGPFPTQMDALRNLLRALDKRSRWIKLKEAIGEFFA